MLLFYKYHSLPTWQNITLLLMIVLIGIIATVLSSPTIEYSDLPRWYDAYYKDEILDELNKMGLSNFTWWCAESRRAERMNHVPDIIKVNEEYRDKINELCDRYNINDDSERLIRRRNNYWKMIRNIKVTIVVRNIIDRLSYNSEKKKEQLSVRNYSIPKEIAACYMQVREMFRIYCVDPDIDEVKEHRYVFVRICEADWLNHNLVLINIKDVCDKIKFF